MGALGDPDSARFDACLRGLRLRSSQQAEHLASELAEERSRGETRKSPQHAGWGFELSGSDVQGLAVFTDGAIVEQRRALITSARKEIWLSSYTWDGAATLTIQLTEKAARGVQVRVVLSCGRVKHPLVRAQLRQLVQGNVAVYCGESTHSKCVVVDGRDVLIGSANLDTSHRKRTIATKLWPQILR